MMARWSQWRGCANDRQCRKDNRLLWCALHYANSPAFFHFISNDLIPGDTEALMRNYHRVMLGRKSVCAQACSYIYTYEV